MNKLKGDNYEKYVLNHLKKDHTNIWLWKDVPERILFDNNIIINYDEYCENRKDIGIDVVGLKDNKLYFYQCKNHQSTVTLDKISGMMFFAISRDVDVNLCYSAKISGFIRQTLDTWKDKMSIKINLMSIPYKNTIIENKNQKNINLEPRQYQLDAIKALKKFKRGLIATPCGTGKTYTSSLIAKEYDNVVIFAPLRELASNLLNTYYKYFDDDSFSKILVSSDTNASRDINTLIKSLDDKNLIASTYASADIMLKLIDKLDNPLIIIDEFHNLSPAQLTDTKNNMYKILKSKHKILFLSATPTDSIKFDKEYRMSWGDAVNNELIHDFNMIIPSGDIMDNDKLDTFIDTLEDLGKISDKKKIMIKQSYFLLRSVKYNGNKKCICFFTTIEATNIFSNIMTQIAKLCNLDIDIQIVVNDIKQKERTERIKKFRESESLSFLLSVHILDEGIDIPECDSVFLAKPDEDIDNLVQRISRCNRMIEGKQNTSTYLWCGYRKLKNILDTINEKFICEIPENITTMHVKTNKVIIKPYAKKITNISNNNMDIQCNIKDNDIWCNKNDICDLVGIKKLTKKQLELIGNENIEINTVDDYDENNIENKQGETYISFKGIEKLINNDDIKKNIVNGIIKYNDHDIIVIVDDSDTLWFYGKQICKILEYKCTNMIISRLNKKNKKKYSEIKDYAKCKHNIQDHAVFINEFALCKLTLKTRMPEGEKLYKWITNEISTTIKNTKKIKSILNILDSKNKTTVEDNCENEDCENEECEYDYDDYEDDNYEETIKVPKKNLFI
jgi:superfamily II DNA or RNA helicase/prophage antirepressor-like protein